MRKNNKRALYESIMRNVAKTVKRTLNENMNDDYVVVVYSSGDVLNDPDEYAEVFTDFADAEEVKDCDELPIGIAYSGTKDDCEFEAKYRQRRAEEEAADNGWTNGEWFFVEESSNYTSEEITYLKDIY